MDLHGIEDDMEIVVFMGIILVFGFIVLGGMYAMFWVNNQNIKGTVTVKAFKGQELVYMKTYKDHVVDLRLRPDKDGTFDRMEIT